VRASPDVERFEELRRRAARLRVDHMFGRLLTWSVGDFVWAKFGQTRGIQLGRVVSPHPVAFQNVDSLRDWWELQIFSSTHQRWVERTTFRRVLRTLTLSELAHLRDAGIIPEAT
jgi:hypothetical protein